MEIFTIPDWTSGEMRIQLPSSIKYVELYDANNVILSDNYTLRIDNVGRVHLDYVNYQGANFPLKLVAFDKNELDSGEPLFGLTLGAPNYQDRVGIGKRHELAKNITNDDLFDYINDYGFAYVTKEFDGINYAAARNNLDVYTTEQVDSMLRGIPADASNINVSEQYDLAPYYTQIPSTIVARGSFGSYLQAGAMHVLLDLRAQCVFNGENLDKNPKIFRVCAASDVVGSTFIPKALTIAMPAMTSLPQLPVTGKYINDLPESMHNANYTMNSLIAEVGTKTSNLPILIMTPNAPTNFCGSDLEPNSIYFYRNSIAPRPGIAGIISFLRFDWPIDVKYELIYYPGDAQI